MPYGFRVFFCAQFFLDSVGNRFRVFRCIRNNSKVLFVPFRLFDYGRVGLKLNKTVGFSWSFEKCARTISSFEFAQYERAPHISLNPAIPGKVAAKIWWMRREVIFHVICDSGTCSILHGVRRFLPQIDCLLTTRKKRGLQAFSRN